MSYKLPKISDFRLMTKKAQIEEGLKYIHKKEEERENKSQWISYIVIISWLMSAFFVLYLFGVIIAGSYSVISLLGFLFFCHFKFRNKKITPTP